MSRRTPGETGDGGYDRHNNSSNASKNEKNIENSPEHAGVVRGLARSAAHRGASRVAVGRLPLPTHVHGTVSSVASKASAARVKSAMTSAKVAKIQNVAKVSEHAYKGIEVAEAHHHAASEHAKAEKKYNNTKDSTSTTRKGSSWMKRASTFGGTLFKNTILGMAVFSGYEVVIGRMAGHSEESPRHSSDEDEATLDEIKSSALWKHYFAGFCAGGVHASLGSLMDSVAAIRTTPLPSADATSPSKWLQTTGRSFYPKFLQHSASHAVLFGSYVTVKRTVALATTTTGPGKETNSTDLKHENHRSHFVDEGIVPVALAGGIAGILQQFAAATVKQLTNAMTNNTSIANESLFSAIKPIISSPRTLLMLSVPNAVGFVAFEYGRQEEALEEEEE